eukprot:g4568.t1
MAHLVGGQRGSVADILKERAIARARAKVYDVDGLPVMSKEAIYLACIENNGYESPRLNTKLYLHFKGFRKIENLEEYTDVSALFLESNGLNSLEGLECLVKLRCLYAQQNIISGLVGLKPLVQLRTLNLSQNRIEKLDVGILACLPMLSTLNLSKNRIDTVDGVKPLLESESLSNLDLSTNELDDPEVLSEVIYKIPKLSCVYLKGNPFVRKVKHYRKNIVVSIPQLAYLDDRPVFELDRFSAEAWKAGGVEGERAARKARQEERRNEDRERRRKFTEWKAKRRAARKAEIEKAKAEGRELPPPKVFVRYDTTDTAEEERLERIRSRAAAGVAEMPDDGEPDDLIAKLGREFAEECGAEYDQNGKLVTDEEKGSAKTDEPSAGNATSSEAPPAPQVSAAPLPRAPTPSTVSEAAEVVKSSSPTPAVSAKAERVNKASEKELYSEQAEESPEDTERRLRVEESMRLYRLSREKRQNTSGSSKPLRREESSVEKPENEQPAVEKAVSSITADVVRESVDLTMEQRRMMEEHVAEAEEEEENYRSSRSRMKAQARAKMQAGSGPRLQTRRQKQEAETLSKEDPMWTDEKDALLGKLVRKHIFDFKKVAQALGDRYSADECRQRFAALDEKTRSESAPSQASPSAPKRNFRSNASQFSRSSPARSARSYQSRDAPAAPADYSATMFDNLPTVGDGNGVPFPKLKPVSVDVSKIPTINFGTGNGDDDEEEDLNDDDVVPITLQLRGVGGLSTLSTVPSMRTAKKAEAQESQEPTDLDEMD